MTTNQNYYSQTLIVQCMKLKLNMPMKILAAMKKCLILVIIMSKYYDDSNKLVIAKMKDETSNVAIEEFIGLKPKMYLFLVHDNSEYKKSHNEYKEVLLHNKCLRDSVSRIQSKDDRIGTYEIDKFPLSCFAEKIYIQNNGYDGSALSYYNQL